MEIFISCAKPRSLQVAQYLKDWLPDIIQAVKPYVYTDVLKGARWILDLAIHLEKSSFGIICVTPENLNEPWLLFESGALSKHLKATYVIPYLFDLKCDDLNLPLSQFNACEAQKEHTWKMIETINIALHEQGGNYLNDAKLKEYFEERWPKFEQRLMNIPRSQEESNSKLSDREMLEEILKCIRLQSRESAVYSWLLSLGSDLNDDPNFTPDMKEALDKFGRMFSSTFLRRLLSEAELFHPDKHDGSSFTSNMLAPPLHSYAVAEEIKEDE